MGILLNGYILPHPPVIVPGIGRGRERQAGLTVDAVKRAAKEIGKDRPTTIILSTPHAPCFKDYVYIPGMEILSGDFAAFGSPDIELSFRSNPELASLIVEKASEAGIHAGGLTQLQRKQYGISDRLDHGALVPLSFIEKELEEFKLVCISTPFLPFHQLYDFGRCIGEAIEESDERVVYIASGDLSHRLTREAPAGYHPKGLEYDEYLVDKVRRSDVKALLSTEEELLEKAGECGTRSILMMYGALHGKPFRSDIYSYEGPFGVGYLIAKINAGKSGEGARDSKIKPRAGGLKEESDYVRLARETLEAYVKEQKRLNIPEWIPPEWKTKRAGVFVSIKKHGNLRGCIGTIGPTMVNIAEEIMNNAISSGTRDPRFPSVTEEELEDLVYSVDVLGRPEKISALEELDVKRYGVIVTSGFRRGLLLPDLEGVDTPEQQVGIALQKAGIGRTDSFEMERFEVIRYL